MPGRKKSARSQANELLAAIKRHADIMKNRLRAERTIYVSLPPATRISELDGKEHTYSQSTTRQREHHEYPENSVDAMRRLYWDAVQLRNLAIQLMEVADARLVEMKEQGQ